MCGHDFLFGLVFAVMVVDMNDIAIIGNYRFLLVNVVSFTGVIIVDMKSAVC